MKAGAAGVRRSWASVALFEVLLLLYLVSYTGIYLAFWITRAEYYNLIFLFTPPLRETEGQQTVNLLHTGDTFYQIISVDKFDDPCEPPIYGYNNASCYGGKHAWDLLLWGRLWYSLLGC